MKTANKINYILIIISIFLGLSASVNGMFLIYFLLSLIPLGLFQIVVAIAFSSKFSGNLHYKIYTYGVMLCLSLVFTAPFWWDYLEPYGEILYGLPPILAIYFSIILHDKSKEL